MSRNPKGVEDEDEGVRPNQPLTSQACREFIVQRLRRMPYNHPIQETEENIKFHWELFGEDQNWPAYVPPGGNPTVVRPRRMRTLTAEDTLRWRKTVRLMRDLQDGRIERIESQSPQSVDHQWIDEHGEMTLAQYDAKFRPPKPVKKQRGRKEKKPGLEPMRKLIGSF